MNFADLISGTRRRREEADAIILEMEQNAGALAVDDPDAFHKAMSEIDQADREAQRLDFAAAELARRQDAARAEEAERERERQRGELKAAVETRCQIAAEIDGALSTVEAGFREFEDLSARIDVLKRALGVPDARIDIQRRGVLFVSAMWHGCPTLAKRLGLRFTPGGAAKHSALARSVGE